MKLLNYTTRYFAILLLPLLTIWAVVFYYAMLEEIYDSLDDGLENQKILLMQRLPSNPQILHHTDLELWNHAVNPISKEHFKKFKESYKDSLMYMLNEEDFEPIRVYETSMFYQNKYYKVKFITSMVEEDDLIQDLITYLIILYILLLVTILLLNNILLKKIWRPFHNLMRQLLNFKIENNQNVQTTETTIDEFKLLNETIVNLINENKARFLEQQHFIENASHELQTPLAISINKLELFLENTELSYTDLETMAVILDNLNRLTRLNKSLLLLSKIENRQYAEEESLDINEILKKIIADFEDFSIHRNIKINFKISSELIFEMNRDLVIILLTNLLKNAVVHSRKHSKIEIESKNSILTFQNYGIENPLDTSIIFSRFKKNSPDKKSSGLGLAISKAISEKYGITIEYDFQEQHAFQLKFPSSS